MCNSGVGYFLQEGVVNSYQAFIKRTFDLVCSICGLAATFWIILPAWLLATLDTGKNGFFTQERVGRQGKIFYVIKIRTMREIPGLDTTVTTEKDQRITRLGRLWRKTKIDELPQLINARGGRTGPACL